MSDAADELYEMLRLSGCKPPVREYQFAKPRRWRFDLAWPVHFRLGQASISLAVEVEGGTWTRGRHTRGKGYEGDCRKYNSAAIAGWTVLRYTTDMVRSGEALTQIERVLNGKK